MVHVAREIKEEELGLDHERRRYLLKINPRLAQCFDILVCLVVRGFLLAQCLFCLYYLCSSTNQYIWLIELICLIVIVLDTVWVVVKRYGQEWYWFSISSFAYTFVLLTTIWQLVYIKVTVGDNDCSENFSEIVNDDHWIFVIFFLNIDLLII